MTMVSAGGWQDDELESRNLSSPAAMQGYKCYTMIYLLELGGLVCSQFNHPKVIVPLITNKLPELQWI